MIFNQPVEITAQADRWPEFAWNIPIMGPIQIDTPYWAMSREDQRIAYGMAASGFKVPMPKPPEHKRVIRLIITRQDADPEYPDPNTSCKLFRAWLIPSRYSHAKYSRLIGEWKIAYASFTFRDVEKQVTHLVGGALRNTA